MRKYFILLAVSLLYGMSACHADTLNIVLTGDILTEGVDSVFRSAQVVVGNLECPATKIQSPVQKLYIFRGEPEWLETLKKHGITHLNLANNHSIDQGREGLMDTRQNIIDAGMTPIGAGANMTEAAEPILLSRTPRNVWLVPSLRLALENYAYLPDKPCVSQEPMDSLLNRVHRLRKADSTAVIIVSLHWGGEHTMHPVKSQRWDARQIIRAGADVLVCHHTHTLQDVEDINGHSVFYSIGNFIFDQSKPENTKACIVRLKITGKTVTTEAIPIEIKNCVPQIVPNF